MEIYVLKDNPVNFLHEGTSEYVASVELQRGDLMQPNIQDKSSAVVSTNRQYTKLKECIGMLKDPEDVTSQSQLRRWRCSGCRRSQQFQFQPEQRVREN